MPSPRQSIVDDVPAVGLVALGHVLGERDLGLVLDRDGVLVVDDGEVAELLVAGQGGGLVRDALHDVAVRGEHPDVVVERAGARLRVGVEQAALATLRHRHADRGGQARAQRARGDLDAVGVVHLGVARGLRAPRAQRLEVVELEPVAGQVELDVLGEAGVPAGQHEPVATEPVRVGRVVPHDVLVEQVGRRSQAHRRARVAVADLLHGVGGEHPDGVHGADVEVGPAGLARHRRTQRAAALPRGRGLGGAGRGGHGWVSSH